MVKLSPKKYEQQRLRAMNQQLYPARLRVLPSGTYQFDYRKNGHSIRKVVGNDIETAYERSLIMRRETDDLPVVSRRDMLLKDWYIMWKKSHFNNLSPTTIRGYEQCWNAAPENLKYTRLLDLNHDQIESSLSLITSDSVRGHTGRFLSVLLGAAVKREFISKAPWHKGYQSPKRNVPMLDENDLVALLEASGSSIQPILALAGFCGLRRGEIFALTKSDFGPDFTNPEWVDVSKARVRGYGKYDCDDIKSTKTGSRRVLPIPSKALPYIIPLLTNDSNGKDDLLFPTFRSDITRRIQTACKKADLPKLTLHDLRHLCGSHIMMQAGPAAAQAILGHKQVSTTVDVYGHLSPLYLKRQMEASSIRDDAILVAEQAEKLLLHDDPEVAELAASALQLCQYLSIRKRKRATAKP